MSRLVTMLLSALLSSSAVLADDFVDVLGKVWVKKGGLACQTARDAIANTTGLFSGCVRVPIALRVAIVDGPDPQTEVYLMRVAGDDGMPKYAWFSRDSLTNNPKPWEFQPGPDPVPYPVPYDVRRVTK